MDFCIPGVTPGLSGFSAKYIRYKKLQRDYSTVQSLQFLPAENITWSDVRKKPHPFHNLHTEAVPAHILLTGTSYDTVYNTFSTISPQGRLRGL